MKKPKIIVISGSTATGKSSLGIYLAKKIGGEVISADSRQIYKGLENFSGAITEKEAGGIRHHLLSFLNPGEIFTAAEFADKTKKLIEEIRERGRTPIIVGGTAFNIKSILYKNFIPEVAPDFEFRKELEPLNTEEIAVQLKEKDINRYNTVDLKNRRRLVRSLEIINKLGYFPKIEKQQNEDYEFYLVELFSEREHIYKKIEKNFLKRKEALLEEAGAIKGKISKNVFSELGLAYKNIYKLWDGEITDPEFTSLGIKEEQKYAKRQQTFLKKLFAEFNGRKKRFNIKERLLKIKVYFLIKLWFVWK